MTILARRALWAVTSVLLAAAISRADGRPPRGKPITIGEAHELDSRILGEKRPYWVYRPASYDGDPTLRYPVLYLLDGDAHFHSASGVVQFMSTGINANVQVPEMIVVGIPNTDRMRDLTPTHSVIDYDGKESQAQATSGGGDAFLRFMREELFPTIESSYRTLPYRVLVGHSLGGLLAVHALLDAPDMFRAYIAIDPSLWWDDQKIVRSASSKVEKLPGPERRIFITLANNPDLGLGDPNLMERAGRELARTLESAGSPVLRSELRYFEAEDHGSVPLLSLYHGLLFFFDDYKPGRRTLVEEPALLQAHFDRFSKRIGGTIPPPEALVNGAGYFMLQLGRTDRAIEWFLLNVRNHPGSFNVWDSLGEGYMVKGDDSLAIENYEKSLEINPDNTNATQKLEELRARAPR